MSVLKVSSKVAYHPKIVKLSRLLGEPQYSVLGRVLMLAWWAATYCKGDNITRYFDRITEATNWDGGHARLTNALFESEILVTDEKGNIYLSGLERDGWVYQFDLDD